MVSEFSCFIANFQKISKLYLLLLWDQFSNYANHVHTLELCAW